MTCDGNPPSSRVVLTSAVVEDEFRRATFLGETHPYTPIPPGYDTA